MFHMNSAWYARADHADLQAVRRIPAGEAVDAVEVRPGVEVVDRALAVDLEGVVVELDVDVAPPDVAGRARLVDDPLVVRAAPRLRARERDQRAGG
jgi:hypothetical protein